MSFNLPPLPYELEALEPFISRKTLDVHYNKHHRGYVEKLNELVKGTSLENASLMELILSSRKANPKVYNNAAQVWNHTFFWHCMTANPVQLSTAVQALLQGRFMSMEDFKHQFIEAAKNLFGSGYIWLVKDASGGLAIRSGQNARNQLTEGEIPILTCDVWEHADYLDYQNDREKFVNRFWNVVDWRFVQQMLGFKLMGDLEDSEINQTPIEL